MINSVREFPTHDESPALTEKLSKSHRVKRDPPKEDEDDDEEVLDDEDSRSLETTTKVTTMYSDLDLSYLDDDDSGASSIRFSLAIVLSAVVFVIRLQA
jgi:hypothetical protein